MYHTITDTASDMEAGERELIAEYRLETQFFPNSVKHTKYVEREPVEEIWTKIQPLGKGGFSTVHLEKEKKGQLRAVKVINKDNLPAYNRELLFMALLNGHGDLFVHFMGWFKDENNVYIAMEYFEKGDLGRYIPNPRSEEDAKSIVKQLLEGLKVMHSKGITHRDLKPENIFVASESPIRVKIGDFGVSKRVQGDETTLHTQVATRLYGAPEVLGCLDPERESSAYTNAVDIWSLGGVIYKLLTGEMPFKSEWAIWSYCMGTRKFPVDKMWESGISEAGIRFTQCLMAPQPEYRPSALAAARDPWLTCLEEGVSGEHRLPKDKSFKAERAAGMSVESASAGSGFTGGWMVVGGITDGAVTDRMTEANSVSGQSCRFKDNQSERLLKFAGTPLDRSSQQRGAAAGGVACEAVVPHPTGMELWMAEGAWCGEDRYDAIGRGLGQAHYQLGASPFEHMLKLAGTPIDLSFQQREAGAEEIASKIDPLVTCDNFEGLRPCMVGISDATNRRDVLLRRIEECELAFNGDV